jgi:hypothetical protein
MRPIRRSIAWGLLANFLSESLYLYFQCGSYYSARPKYSKSVEDLPCKIESLKIVQDEFSFMPPGIGIKSAMLLLQR